MKTKRNYIDKQRFMEEMVKWRDSAQSPDDRVPSEELGRMLLQLHDHILTHRNFSGYRQDLKEEMKSYSLFRILKGGLKSFDFQKSTPFSYFSHAIFINYYNLLKRYYTRMNNHQRYVRDTLFKMDTHGDQSLQRLLKEFKLWQDEEEDKLMRD